MREMTILNMWAGQFYCEAFNLVIKRLVKQARPPGKLSYGCRINLDLTLIFQEAWAMAMVFPLLTASTWGTSQLSCFSICTSDTNSVQLAIG
jgi:hypothetical protein